MTDQLAGLRGRFSEEASERATRLANYLGILPTADSQQIAVLSSMRKEAHTLKGAAGVFGEPELHAAAARLEELTAGLADGKELDTSAKAELAAGVAAVKAALPA